MRATSRQIISRIARVGLMTMSLALAGLAVNTSALHAAGPMETVMVTLDHAKIIRLPEKTQTVVIGNPIIADVAVQKNGVMIVTAKAFGETNLIALDSSGNMLAESKVVVQVSRDSTITVQRGMDRESYACAPACQPAIQLGDSQAYFAMQGAQSKTRNSLATSESK